MRYLIPAVLAATPSLAHPVHLSHTVNPNLSVAAALLLIGSALVIFCRNLVRVRARK